MSTNKVKIGVLVSGGGTNLQALIDAQNSGKLVHGEVCVVVSSKKDVYALERAKIARIDGFVVPRIEYGENIDSFSENILEIFIKKSVELVVLAGFLSVLSPKFVEFYKDRIINVHPALIPAFCGKGFYGIKVHEEVLKRGVKVSGATVHLVNEIVDGGKILDQKVVRVLSKDTAESLQKRIMVECEQVILPRSVEKLCKEISKRV